MEKVLFLLIFGMITHTYLQGQVADHNLLPISDEQLRYQERANRYEGFYESDVSDYSLSLLNLTCGKIAYSLSFSEVIEISPLFNNNRSIHIQSSANQLRVYYRMDAEIASDSKLEWPVSDVLRPGNLTDDKIGIYGIVLPEDKKMRTLIPLIVNSSIQRNSGCNQLYLVFVSNMDLDLIGYSVYQIDDDSDSDFVTIADRTVYAGTPIEIYIDIGTMEEDCGFIISGRIDENEIDNESGEDHEREWIRDYFTIDLVDSY